MAAQPIVIPVDKGGSQVLSVVLDTATGPMADMHYPSWGTFSRIYLIPYIGHQPQPALVLDWQASPFDPDGGTQIHAAGGLATIALAQRQAGASIDAAQPGGIWGASAVLPGRGANGAYTSIELRFDYALQSWDTRDAPAAAEATGVSLALLAVALLAAWRRPRRAPA